MFFTNTLMLLFLDCLFPLLSHLCVVMLSLHPACVLGVGWRLIQAVVRLGAHRAGIRRYSSTGRLGYWKGKGCRSRKPGIVLGRAGSGG